MKELQLINESESQKAINQFKEVAEKKQSQAEKTISLVVDAICDALVRDDIVESGDTHFVVNMSDEIKEKLKTGEIKLDSAGGENFYAQIRNANGKYGDKISIHEELINKGITPGEIRLAQDVQAIECELADMMKVLNCISEDVTSILNGQKNDRIGMYYSGKNLFLEAQNVQDGVFKSLLMSQALKSISDSSSQIMRTFQDDITYLSEEKFNANARGRRRIEEIKGKMLELNSCFEIINCAYIDKASIYYYCGELQALLTVLDEYGAFLDEWIVPNSWMLSEYESNKKLLDEETWQNRANALTAVESMRMQLSNNHAGLLEMELV